MIKKRHALILSAVLAVSLTAGAGVVATNARTDAPTGAFIETEWEQHSPSTAWSKTDFKSEYDYGSHFTVPTRTVTIDGKSVNATSVLQFPDGSATRLTNVTLDMSGVYCLRYTAIVGGVPYYDEYKFTVVEPLFGLSGEKSSFTYGKWDALAAGSPLDVTTSGLLVSLAEGETFTVNQLIDVRNASKTQALFEGFVTPTTMGTADFENLTFTFTDAVNPDVYFRVKAQQSVQCGEPITYYLAGAEGQQLSGYEPGNPDKIHVNNEWGCREEHSFTGKFVNGAGEPIDRFALDTKPISLRYDSSENAVYASDSLIIDFDSPKFFSKLWDGFESGFVRLSITAGNYKNTRASFCISKIFGVDLTGKKVDSETPAITTDADSVYSATAMPAAKRGESYRVPTAVAFDHYCGNTEVKTSVYYNYESPNAISVPVSNGSFVADRTGMYAIVYDATNSRGKSARKILWVECKNTIPAITVSGGSIGTTEAATCGIYKTVSADGLTIEGGSGEKTVRIYLEYNGETTEIKDGFRPEAKGDYTVKFVATDYIGQTGTAQYTVRATAGSLPVFVDEPILPAYFIEGGEYTVPEAFANDYSGGTLSRVAATVTIDGTHYAVGAKFAPTAQNNGDTVAVVFDCKGAKYSRNVPVVKPYITENIDGDGESDNLHMENYFVGEGVECEPTVNSVTVTAMKSDGGFTFANALLAENFTMRLRGIAGSTRFGGLTVRFADSENRNKTVTATIENTGNGSTVRLGNGKVSLDYGFATGGTFALGLGKGALTVDAAAIEIAQYDDGTAFDGFASGKIMLSINFYDAEGGNAAFNMLSVNSQTLTNMTLDRNGPKIAIVGGDYGGVVSYGETKTLPTAVASDVLTPFINSFTLTVTDPDGQAVTDTDGRELRNVDPSVAYTIRFDKYGQYNVRYTAKDSARGSTSNLRYTFITVDEVAPEITVINETVKEAKVGDAIALPDFEVSDNISSKENIKVLKYVLNPNGELLTIPEGSNSIKCAFVGTYEFRIIAVDEAGNMQTKRFVVTVTQA